MIRFFKWLFGRKGRCEGCSYYRPDHTGFNGGTCDGPNEYRCTYTKEKVPDEQ